MAGPASITARQAGLSKLLVLATEDMRQAAAAARALKKLRAQAGNSPSDDQYHLIHVLETGLVVAYMRPFTERRKAKPLSVEEFVPKKWRHFHIELRELRNKVYAHIDEHPRRDGDITHGEDRTTGVSGHGISVHTQGLSPETLDQVIAMCDEQAHRFEAGLLARHMFGRSS